MVGWIERLRAACAAAAAVAAPIGVWSLAQSALAGAPLGPLPPLVAKAAAAVGLGTGAGAAAGVQQGAWVLGWPMLMLAAAALLARRKLQDLWVRFHFKDYVHADVE